MPTLYPRDPKQKAELETTVELYQEAESHLSMLKELGAGHERIKAQEVKVKGILTKLESLTGVEKINQDKETNFNRFGHTPSECTLDGVADLFRKSGFKVDPLNDSVRSVTATKDRARVEIRLVDPKRYAYVNSTPNSVQRHMLGDKANTDRRLSTRDNVHYLSDSINAKQVLNIEIVGTRGENYGGTIFREATPGMDVVKTVRDIIAVMLTTPSVADVLTIGHDSPMLE